MFLIWHFIFSFFADNLGTFFMNCFLSSTCPQKDQRVCKIRYAGNSSLIVHLLSKGKFVFLSESNHIFVDLNVILRNNVHNSYFGSISELMVICIASSKLYLKISDDVISFIQSFTRPERKQSISVFDLVGVANSRAKLKAGEQNAINRRYYWYNLG